MFDALHPYLPLADDETHLSWAARLAALHTGGRMSGFLRDAGIGLDALIRGEAEAVATLAALGGEPLERVRRSVIRRVTPVARELRCEHFTAEITTDPATVFCPRCLAEDDAAGHAPAVQRRGRLIWRFAHVRVCPAHRIPLMRRAAEAWDAKTHEMAVRVPERAGALARLADSLPEVGAPSPLQDYLVARLDGAAGPAWLDGQTLEQAVTATELLGTVLAFGRFPDPETPLTARDLDEAGRVGFEAAARGTAGVRAALAEIQSRPIRSKGPVGPQAAFGILYQRLRNVRADKDPGPLRDLLRAHILETMEIAGGTRLLGTVVERRRLHSAASLARATGQDRRTVRNLLVAQGLVPAEDDGPLPAVFDAAAGAALVENLRDAIPVAGLPKALGCARPLAEQLVATGMLPTLGPDAPVKRGYGCLAVTRPEAAAFLERLARVASPVAAAPPDHVPLAKAAETTKTTSAVLLRKFLDGEIAGVVRVASEHGIAALRLPAAALPRREHPADRPVGLCAAFDRLRLSHAAGLALLDSSFGAEHLPTAYAKRGRRRAGTVRQEDFETFLQTFVTTGQLCRETGLHHQTLGRHLREAGVTPILEIPEVKLRIFRRADIAQLETEFGDRQ